MMFLNATRSFVLKWLMILLVILTITTLDHWCVFNTLMCALLVLSTQEYISQANQGFDESEERGKLIRWCLAFLIWNAIASKDAKIGLASGNLLVITLVIEDIFCNPDSPWCR